MKQKDCGCSDEVGGVARENHEGWKYMVQQYSPNLLDVLVENDRCTPKELPSGIQQDGQRKTAEDQVPTVPVFALRIRIDDTTKRLQV